MGTMEPVTYVLILNDSVLQQYEQEVYYSPVYVHGIFDIVVLSLLVIGSFGSNALVAATLVSHRYLWQTPFYIQLLFISCLHMLDCIFNGALSLVYMMSITWTIGVVLCQLNVLVIHTLAYAIPWLVVHVAVDRFVVLRNPSVYRDKFKVTLHCMMAMGAIAVISLVIAMPLSTRSLPVRPFPARMACGAATLHNESWFFDDDVLYMFALAVLVLMVLLPSTAILVSSVLFTQILLRDYRAKKRVHASSGLDSPTPSTGSLLGQNLSYYETRYLLLWLILALCCILGILPYAVQSAIYQVSDVLVAAEKAHWEVTWSPLSETFLAWLRYLVTLVHPVVVLALVDDVRQEALVLVKLLRPGSTSGLEGIAGPFPAPIRRASVTAILGQLRTKPAVSTASDPAIPVLFPTGQGLYFRRALVGYEQQFDCVFCDNFSPCCVGVGNHLKDTKGQDLRSSPNADDQWEDIEVVKGQPRTAAKRSKVPPGRRVSQVRHEPVGPAPLKRNRTLQNRKMVDRGQDGQWKSFRSRSSDGLVRKSLRVQRALVKRRRTSAIIDAQLISPNEVWSRMKK